MTPQEYEKALSIVQKNLLNSIDRLEEAFESSKEEITEYHLTDALKTFLHVGLLVVHTDRGRALFLRILRFSSGIDAGIAEEFWYKFDDIDNLIKKRYFDLT